MALFSLIMVMLWSDFDTADSTSPTAGYIYLCQREWEDVVRSKACRPRSPASPPVAAPSSATDPNSRWSRNYGSRAIRLSGPGNGVIQLSVRSSKLKTSRDPVSGPSHATQRVQNLLRICNLIPLLRHQCACRVWTLSSVSPHVGNQNSKQRGGVSVNGILSPECEWNGWSVDKQCNCYIIANVFEWCYYNECRWANWSVGWIQYEDAVNTRDLASEQ